MTKLVGPQNVFVYGSLMSGLYNHPALIEAKAKFISTAETKESYYMVSLGRFPAVMITLGESPIKGELYQIDAEMIENRLDILEGYPLFYDRREIPLSKGELAWMYYIQYSDGWTQSREVVPNGDWRAYLSRDKVQAA